MEPTLRELVTKAENECVKTRARADDECAHNTWEAADECLETLVRIRERLDKLVAEGLPLLR